MSLDLSSVEGTRTRMIRLRGALDGWGILIKHRTMKEREHFENRMIREGIMKKDGGGINQGRLSDFIYAFTEEVVVGWDVPERFRSGDTKDKNPPYDPKEMVKVFNHSPSSLEYLFDELKEEANFFSENRNGSTG
jgi:hypothetical protein